MNMTTNPKHIKIKTVTNENWRELTKIKVNKDQKKFVTDPWYYLCLCSYGDLWNPLAIHYEKKVIGFLMWAIDEDDNSCWLGGIMIDAPYQKKGLGKAAIEKAMVILKKSKEISGFALSYRPENEAKHLYKKLGFKETGEMEDNEVVARRVFAKPE